MANKLNSILIALAMIGLIAVGVTSYQVIRRIDDQVRSIQKWVGAIDKAFAQSEQLDQVDRRLILSLINRGKESPGQPEPRSSQTSDAQTNDTRSTSPTITLFGDESCGPCIDWYRNDAPKWESQGWIVKKEQADGKRPRPYFLVNDGKREFWVYEKLTSDSYNRASMKGISYDARSNGLAK